MPAMDDEDRPKKKIVHEIGQDLTLLSVEELGERIALLKEEIARLEGGHRRKKASRTVADQFFKRSAIESGNCAGNPLIVVVKLSRTITVIVHLLDIEWLLSTLFDASLLSP